MYLYARARESLRNDTVLKFVTDCPIARFRRRCSGECETFGSVAVSKSFLCLFWKLLDPGAGEKFGEIIGTRGVANLWSIFVPRGGITIVGIGVAFQWTIGK